MFISSNVLVILQSGMNQKLLPFHSHFIPNQRDLHKNTKLSFFSYYGRYQVNMYSDNRFSINSSAFILITFLNFPPDEILQRIHLFDKIVIPVCFIVLPKGSFILHVM